VGMGWGRHPGLEFDPPDGGLRERRLGHRDAQSQQLRAGRGRSGARERQDHAVDA
jgi:hypothetical protein